MTTPPTVAVIGGGFGGLGAAWALARSGVDVHVYETLPQPGGLAGGFKLNGTPLASTHARFTHLEQSSSLTNTKQSEAEPLERFYHHLFHSDTTFQATLKELGLHKRLAFFRSTNGFWHDGQIYNLSSPLGLLGFKPLHLWDRIRFGLFVLAAQRRKDWHALDALTAHEWVHTQAGEEIWKVIWEPLAKAKFGRFADTISAAWLWNKIVLRSSTRRGIFGGEELGYIRGGFNIVAQSLVNEIERRKGRFFWQRTVQAVEPLPGGGIRLITQGRRTMYDAVVLTIAPEVCLKIVQGFSPLEKMRLGQVRHQANICVVLTLQESLSPVYWLSVGDVRFPFVAVIEHTRLVPAQWYGGRHILYLSRYTDPQDEWFLADEATILRRIPGILKTIFPRFDADQILAAQVSRARFTQPITPVGYGAMRFPHKTSLPGLYLATMAQIYPQDRGTNYALQQGYEVARQVGEYLRAG